MTLRRAPTAFRRVCCRADVPSCIRCLWLPAAGPRWRRTFHSNTAWPPSALQTTFRRRRRAYRASLLFVDHPLTFTCAANCKISATPAGWVRLAFCLFRLAVPSIASGLDCIARGPLRVLGCGSSIACGSPHGGLPFPFSVAIPSGPYPSTTSSYVTPLGHVEARNSE